MEVRLGFSHFKCTANLSAFYNSEFKVTTALAGTESSHHWCFIFLAAVYTVTIYFAVAEFLPLLFEPVPKRVYREHNRLQVKCLNDNEHFTGTLIWRDPAGKVLPSQQLEVVKDQNILVIDLDRNSEGNYSCEMRDVTPSFYKLPPSTFTIEIQCMLSTKSMHNFF